MLLDEVVDKVTNRKRKLTPEELKLIASGGSIGYAIANPNIVTIPIAAGVSYGLLKNKRFNVSNVNKRIADFTSYPYLQIRKGDRDARENTNHPLHNVNTTETHKAKGGITANKASYEPSVTRGLTEQADIERAKLLERRDRARAQNKEKYRNLLYHDSSKNKTEQELYQLAEKGSRDKAFKEARNHLALLHRAETHGYHRTNYLTGETKRITQDEVNHALNRLDSLKRARPSIIDEVHQHHENIAILREQADRKAEAKGLLGIDRIYHEDNHEPNSVRLPLTQQNGDLIISNPNINDHRSNLSNARKIAPVSTAYKYRYIGNKINNLEPINIRPDNTTETPVGTTPSTPETPRQPSVRAIESTDPSNGYRVETKPSINTTPTVITHNPVSNPVSNPVIPIQEASETNRGGGLLSELKGTLLGLRDKATNQIRNVVDNGINQDSSSTNPPTNPPINNGGNGDTGSGGGNNIPPTNNNNIDLENPDPNSRVVAPGTLKVRDEETKQESTRRNVLEREESISPEGGTKTRISYQPQSNSLQISQLDNTAKIRQAEIEAEKAKQEALINQQIQSKNIYSNEKLTGVNNEHEIRKLNEEDRLAREKAITDSRIRSDLLRQEHKQRLEERALAGRQNIRAIRAKASEGKSYVPGKGWLGALTGGLLGEDAGYKSDEVAKQIYKNRGEKELLNHTTPNSFWRWIGEPSHDMQLLKARNQNAQELAKIGAKKELGLENIRQYFDNKKFKALGLGGLGLLAGGGALLAGKTYLDDQKAKREQRQRLLEEERAYNTRTA